MTIPTGKVSNFQPALLVIMMATDNEPMAISDREAYGHPQGRRANAYVRLRSPHVHSMELLTIVWPEEKPHTRQTQTL